MRFSNTLLAINLFSGLKHKMDRSLQIRVGWVIISFLLGFIFPLSFALSVYLAFTIYGDLSDSSAPQSKANNKSIENNLFLESSLEDFRAKCESPAETAFLDIMIRSFNLTPEGADLKGEDLSLRMQVPIHRYRVDFLVDERLVVEIDGAAWHSSKEAVERDRIRDSYLKGAGYHVLRIAAKIPLFKPHTVPSLVTKACKNMQGEICEESRQKAELRKEIIKPKNLIKSLNTTIDSFSNGLEEMHKTAKKHEAIAFGRNEADAIWLELRANSEMLLKHSKFMLDLEEKISKQPQAYGELYNSTLKTLIQNSRNDKNLEKKNLNSTSVSFAESLAKADLLLRQLTIPSILNVDSDTKKHRDLGRNKSINEFRSFVGKIISELNVNNKLAERFETEWEKMDFKNGFSPDNTQ